jgi:hypothetical protein
MIIATLIVAILGCLFILFIGARFLYAPAVAVAGFGVPAGNLVPLVVLAVSGSHVFGWALLAAALTPIGDAIIVTTNGGTLRHALSVHGATALVLVVAGLILALA